MSKLTKRQQEVLNLVENYIEEHSSAPTRVEIAKLMGFRSPNAAEDHLKALAKKGAIELVPGTSRGIRLTQNQGLPIIGQVASGQPMMSEQHIETNYRMDKTLFQPPADYLLRVAGNSMKDAGISNGDLLVVHVTKMAHNGQIVIARISNDLTVRRFNQEKNLVTLSPENIAYESITIDSESPTLEIEGVAVGVIKTKL